MGVALVVRDERPTVAVWEICQRICGIIVVGGITFFVCVDINCITLDPNIPLKAE